MAKQNDTGVYQLPNGNWAYRFTFTVEGKKKNRKGTKDEFGNLLTTKRAAILARAAAVTREQEEQHRQAPVTRKTFQEVYKEYCEQGRSGKAYQTIRKQDSIWNNHLCAKFGRRYIDEISVAEVNDYLAHLYYTEGRAYKYVESFLKMFYLIFGQAYSRNYLEVDTYNKLCVNKDVRIRMPKMKVDEDAEIVAFTPDEVARLDEYFKGTNAETAYLLGRCCGLRINECYGLKWENIDTKRGTITIDRQMQYQEGLIKLVSLKTRNARRTVYMSDKLKAYLRHLERENKAQAAALAAQRAQNQTFITDIDGKQISSLELVNTLPNGKIQTVNSMKYHSKTIKAKFGINFKFHYLRHTYGTRLAEMNTPTHILCNQMGHASGKVTERYYLAVSKPGIEVLTHNLNAM
ncbi:site-specific integrase [Pseudoflavonifractor capillosus]|uniref:Site-specific integrase n=2 Tax=Oscillospiraceae TaxID=216572 RepID=A0A921MLH0_9FIRM|nr:site-specific integrase [Pseudoflavonifractor capillosus]HJG86713.1 site-specific integrase [Pseudoflavonifractor capillosus]